jgi:hypothetical protein
MPATPRTRPTVLALFAILLTACSPSYDEENLRMQMREQYAPDPGPRGWILREFTRIRPQQVGDDTLLVHAEYVYEGRSTGTDRRLFVFESVDGAWQVSGMGEHESARLD